MFKVGFIGANNTDMILYLSRIFINLKLETAIIDSSVEQLLRYSVHAEEEEPTYRGVDIYLNKNMSGSLNYFNADKYDIIIVDYGLNHDMLDDSKLCDLLLISTDFERDNIIRLKDVLKSLEDITVVKIYRNVMKTKISPKYIDALLNIHMLDISREYVLPFYENNQRSRLSSQYDDVFTFADISDKLRTVILEIAEMCTKFDGKTVEKALKKAERGE